MSAPWEAAHFSGSVRPPDETGATWRWDTATVGEHHALEEIHATFPPVTGPLRRPWPLETGYHPSMTMLRPPTYIVWSTDQVDLSDPFQRRWYMQQVLTHGRMEDVRALNPDEIAAELDDMILPDDVRSLRVRFLGTHHAQG